MEYNLSPNFLIYFHGNAEHIFGNELFGFHFAREFHINIIFVEYKGYSIYKGKPDSKTILDDSLIVYDFIRNNFNNEEVKIISCGRSLGTSPAIYLASKKRVDALITISAFESIKTVAKSFFAGLLFPDIFKSIDNISDVNCPALFIHGQKDSLISYTNSENLYNKCKTEKSKKYIYLGSNMTHNQVDFKEDIVIPIKNFFDKLSILTKSKNCLDIKNPNFKKLFETPQYIQLFIEDKTFNISEFSKLNEKSISCSEDTLILPLSNEYFVYTSNNILYLCKYYDIIFQEEEKEGNIIYLYSIKHNKFVYITDRGDLKIYTFDIDKITFINKILLNKPKKIIHSHEDIFYILGNSFVKLKIKEAEDEEPEKIKEISYFTDNNNNDIQFNNFSDILEVTKNIIVLSSIEKKIFISICIEKNIIITSKEISPTIKNNLYKLNENEFAVIEELKISIFNSTSFDCMNRIDIKPYDLFYFINEEKIILTKNDKKHNVEQFNLKENNYYKEGQLVISNYPNEIKQIHLTGNKTCFITLIKSISKILFFQTKIEYKIEIWNNMKKDKTNSNSLCEII